LLRWPCNTLYLVKLALISPTSGSCSVSIVRLRNKVVEFVLFCMKMTFSYCVRSKKVYSLEYTCFPNANSVRVHISLALITIYYKQESVLVYLNHYCNRNLFL
jgi:hypothetical protein